MLFSFEEDDMGRVKGAVLIGKTGKRIAGVNASEACPSPAYEFCGSGNHPSPQVKNCAGPMQPAAPEAFSMGMSKRLKKRRALRNG